MEQSQPNHKPNRTAPVGDASSITVGKPPTRPALEGLVMSEVPSRKSASAMRPRADISLCFASCSSWSASNSARLCCLFNQPGGRQARKR